MTFLSAALLLALTTGTASAQTKTVNLRVLVISGGNQETSLNGQCVSYADPSLNLIKQVLDQMVVPYDVYDANANQLLDKGVSPKSSGALAANVLATGNAGQYNGVILTDSSALGLVNPGSCNGAYEPKMAAAEWKALQDYESQFGVRESVISGSLWPWVSDGQVNVLDYGMDSTAAFIWKNVGAVTANWVSPAGGTQFFEYINTATSLTLDGGFAWVGKPRLVGSVPTATTPSVQPLLRVGTDNNQTLISIVRYAANAANGRPNVREVLVSGISNATYLLYSQKLAYEFVNFATKGVFPGGRYAYLTAHNDDLLLPNELWNPAELKTSPTNEYRITSANFNNLVTAQNSLRGIATANAFTLDFAFNGSGTTAAFGGLPENTASDALTTAVRSNRNNFRFINHTWRHWDNDIHANLNPCLQDQDDTATTAPYATEVTLNQTAWQKLGLPQQTENNVVMVSGDHSGLKDDGCEADPWPLTGYNNGGRNDAWLGAIAGAGIKYVASDSSQPDGQGEEKYSSSNILLLPRVPTSIYFNVTQWGNFNNNPAVGALGDLVSEYNYINWKRVIDQGNDPCNTPGAICAPRNQAQILAAEVQNAMRHILTYRQWPFFFHQANLKNYGSGKTLQFDWLNAVVGEYNKTFKLPLNSPAYYQIGADTANRVKARQATLDGYASLNASGDPVTVTIRVASGGPVTIPMTGITKPTGNAALYGGQSVQSVTLTDALQTFNVSRNN